MSTDRDTTRIGRSWLRTDEHESADRGGGAVLDRSDTIPQRRATPWPARRLPEMNDTAKLTLGAAAVVVAALLGIGLLLPGGPNIGSPGPALPTAEPTPSPQGLLPVGSSHILWDAEMGVPMTVGRASCRESVYTVVVIESILNIVCEAGQV